ncbi:hypothetical protein Peur_059930 [Populus x canadensis]
MTFLGQKTIKSRIVNLIKTRQLLESSIASSATLFLVATASSPKQRLILFQKVRNLWITRSLPLRLRPVGAFAALVSVFLPSFILLAIM